MATKTYNAQTLLVAAKPRNKRLREIGDHGGSSATVDVDLTPYLLKATFDDMFEKVNIGSEEEPKWSIKAKYGLWTEQFLSAKGVGSDTSTGGGGGIDYEALEEYLRDNLAGYLSQYAKISDIPDVSGFLTDYDVKSISVNGGAQQPLKGSGNVDIKAATSIDGSGHITAGALQSDGTIEVGVESGYSIPSNSKQQGWDAAKALLEDLFEKVNVNGVPTIKAKYGLWTDQFLSAKGVGDGSAEGGIGYEAVQEMIAEALQGYNPSTGEVDWDSITGKPDTFAPSSHSHTWGSITGKPSTFAPSSHSHAIDDVTELQIVLDGKVSTSRTITAGTGLTGGGNLTADRTIKLSDTNVALLAMLSGMFEWDKSKDTTSDKTDSSKWVIKAKASLWTNGYLSAKGTEEGSEGSAIDDINADILDIRAQLQQDKAQWQSAVSNANANIVQVSGALDTLNTTVNAIPRVSVDANGKLTIDGTEKKLSYSNLSDKPTIPSVSLSNGTITIDGSTIEPITSHQSLADYAKTSDIPTLGISDAGVITIGDKTITPYTSSNKPSAADIGARPDTWTPTAADVGVTLSNGSISIGGTSIKPITALRKIKIGSTEYDLTANTGSAAVGITAASVGARASDWMPSAADVGARPNTWTPTATEVGVPTWAQAESKPSYTASEVGARASNWMPTAADVGADPAGTAATKASAAETAAKNYADGLLNLRGDGTGGTAATGRFASLKLQLNGSDVGTYNPLASSTKTINVAGVLTTSNYSSYVTKSYIEGLNAGRFGFAFDNNTLLEDWVKATASSRKAGNVFSVDGWAWANSSNLKLTDSISVDRMRYSAISIRDGNLTGTWNQQAMLFVPTHSDVSNIYLAQMCVGGTAGEVTTAVKRYADYDTIMADVGNAYLPLTGGTLTGNLTVNSQLKLESDNSYVFMRSGRVGPYLSASDSTLNISWHNASNSFTKSLAYFNNNGDFKVYGNIYFDGNAGGVFLKDSSSTMFGGIYYNGANLWIGATETVGYHHTGATYISAGMGKGLYCCIPADGNRGGTSYPILHSGNISPYLAPYVPHRANGSLYTCVADYYHGGTASKYVCISLPSSVAYWTMLQIECSIRVAYSTGQGGKLIIRAYSSNPSTAHWSGFNAETQGYGTGGVKVYGHLQKFYVEGIGAYGGLTVDRVLVGDTARNYDIGAWTTSGVAELPSGYTTAAMYRTLDSHNMSSHVTKSYIEGLKPYAQSVRDYDYHDYTHRRSSLNVNYADAALHYFLSTSSVTDGSWPCDGPVLHASWDNGSWEHQLVMGNGDAGMWHRGMNGPGWGSWKAILDSDNYSSYALPLTGGTLTGNLTVNGTVTATGYKGAYLQGNTTNGAFFGDADSALGNGNAGAVMWAYGNNPSFICTNGTVRMYVSGGGNVGIGTTSPAYKLDVNGSMRASGTLSVWSNSGSYCQGMRIHAATDGWTTLMLCGAENTADTGTSANSWSMHAYQGNFYLNKNSANGSTGNELCNVGGNWGIGTTSPDAKLHVAGAVHATDNITSDKECVSKFTTSSSDERLKRVTGGVDIALRSIAEAPSIRFDWRDGSGKDAGSIAQYWQDILPEAVRTDSKGYLTMQYGKLALLSAISLARNAVGHEARIAQLEGEVERLKQEVERLSA